MPPNISKPLAFLSRGLLASTLLGAMLVGSTFWLAARSKTADEWVRHTLAVRNQIAEVLILVQRVETSQRGYLLTGRGIYLAPFENAAAALPPTLDKLASLLADNPPQQQKVNELRRLSLDKLGELRTTIDEWNAGRRQAALAIVNNDTGLRLMDEIRQLAMKLDHGENEVLAARQASSTKFGLLLQIGTGVLFLVICLIGVLMSVLNRRSFTEIATAQNQLMVANRELVEQIHQRERSESQLRQSQKMEAIGQLTGGIAHDFNNMLGVIGGNLDLIQRRIKKGDFGIERFIEAAVKAAERAAALTHRLLAFARQQPLSPQPLDANKMIANMSDLLRSTLGEHIRIENVSAGGLWTTKADAHQLESAILNIAINARDAMPGAGKLTIETANAYLDDPYCKQHAEVEPGQFVMIAITDTGTGIAPELVARIFEPFFTTKAPGAGTGLGLSQVYGFVKQSRGHIKVYSEPEAGTTVKIYLPRFIGEAQELARIPSGPPEIGHSGEVILVVEDDALMRRLAGEALREVGYTVLDSENAVKALELLDSRPDIKLLFTDVVLPEVNGKKLADEALRRRPDLKVLFTTGYTPNAVVHGGILDAGVQFLTKPFTLEQVAAKVRAVLDSARTPESTSAHSP